jgi:hypothetical protein
MVAHLGSRKRCSALIIPPFAGTRANLGALYKSQGRYADAEPFLRSALNIREKAFASSFVANSLTQLAELLTSSCSTHLRRSSSALHLDRGSM